MASQRTPVKIEISAKTVVFTVLFLIALKFLWIIRDLIFSLFIAFILVSALKPPVAFLVKKRIPRFFATLFVYLIFLLCIGNIVGLIFPPLIREIAHFIRHLPRMIENSPPYISSFINIEFFSQYVPNITNRTLDVIRNVFSNALFIISTLFFGFYLLLDGDTIKKIFLRFYPERELKTAFLIITRAEGILSAWLWGEVVLMAVVGLMTFVGLNLIGMKYTLSLAVLAGLLEVVPTIGPITSLVPAAIIGFSISYFLGFANIALYFIIQQFENHIIVPLVMKKAVGLNPIATLVALIIGGKLAGVLGVLLSVPTMLLLETILLEAQKTKKL